MKVLLVDDHPLILSALKTMLEAMEPGIEVLTVETAHEAHALLARSTGFNLVLLDLLLADADGFQTLVQLRADHPDVPVVVLSAIDQLSEVVRAVDLGAMAFVPKRSSTTELRNALAMVMHGSVYVPPGMLGLGGQPGSWAGVVAQMAEGGALSTDSAVSPRAAAPLGGPFGGPAAEAAAPTATTGAPAPALPPAGQGLATLGLTPRQTDVLGLLLKGLPNKLIARELNLSVETVKDHVAAVLRALGVSSRTQAVLAVGRLQQSAGA